MEDSIVYLANVSPQCTELDLYKIFAEFGNIKKIRIFCEVYHGVSYPTGYASVQFTDEVGYTECVTSEKRISFDDKILRIYKTKPETEFASSLFVFFSSYSVTRESIIQYFANTSPTDVTIKCEVAYDHLGFAIVEFATAAARNRAFGLSIEAPFQIMTPSRAIVDLWGNDRQDKAITFEASFSSFLDAGLHQKFMNMEIIYNDTSYRVNSFIASRYSRRINQALLSNSLLDLYKIRIKKEGPFEMIVKVLLGQPVKITKGNAEFLFLVAADLEIDSLIESTSGIVCSQLTPVSALNLYRDLGDIELSEGPHIKYMAANIDEMRALPEFVQAPIQLLAAVFHHKDFYTAMPDAFCDWLLGFVRQSPKERMRLLQYLMVESMSRKDVIDLVENPAINNNLIRNSLLSFMKQKVDASVDSYNPISCQQKPDSPNHGVFATLCERLRGNPQDFGMVEVTSSSTIEHVIEPEWDDYWSTPNISNSWICFDFKDYQLIPSAYTLKPSCDVLKIPCMVSWRVEGSRDGGNWDLLDEQRNVAPADDSSEWSMWSIKTKNTYRYIRITQTDKNNSGNFCMFIHGIEMFGSLPSQKVNIIYEKGKESNGVFSYLTERAHSNPVTAGQIAITSSCDPKFLLEEKWEGCWRSPKELESWVTIDMINMRLVLDKYALRTHYGPGHIQSWKVEVAGEDKKWRTVDTRTNVTDYTEPYQTHYWICNSPWIGRARYIRFTMPGVPEQKEETISWLSNIELFGDLLKPK